MKRRPRNWKRTLFKVGVFLLLGAIVNVAVAWGLMLRQPMDRPSLFSRGAPCNCYRRSLDKYMLYRTGELEIREMIRVEPIRWAVTSGDLCKTLTEKEFTSFLPTWSGFAGDRLMRESRELLKAGDKWLEVFEVTVGWPMVCLRTTVSCRENHAEEVIIQSDGLALPRSWQTQSRAALPVRPIAWRFAGNSIFFAALLWLLWLLWIAPGKVRRGIRVHRSQCPACGHIIAPGTCANGLCSECASPLPKGFKPKPEASAQT